MKVNSGTQIGKVVVIKGTGESDFTLKQLSEVFYNTESMKAKLFEAITIPQNRKDTLFVS